MRRATERLCVIEPGQRCADARQKLDNASQRVGASCPMCVATAPTGDEAPPARLPELYGNILCWSSDVYHHDGDDAWRAIETMQKYGLPKEDQAKFLGANARRLYKVQAPANIIRERVTEIERPDWWPTEDEVRASLQPEAAVRRQ